jgi:hypothetical protein
MVQCCIVPCLPDTASEKYHSDVESSHLSKLQVHLDGSVALLTDCAVTAASVIVQPAAS